MKSKKITSLKKAREIIEQSGILEVYEDNGTTYANCVTWQKDIDLGQLHRDCKSHKVYMSMNPNPSGLRAIGKVFNYEIVCNIYGGFDLKDYSILWLKEAANECTS